MYTIQLDFTDANPAFKKTTVAPRLPAPIMVAGTIQFGGKVPKPKQPLDNLASLEVWSHALTQRAGKSLRESLFDDEADDWNDPSLPGLKRVRS